MKANDFKCYDEQDLGDSLHLWLDCTPQEALDIDATRIVISTDQGDIVKVYGAYYPKFAQIAPDSDRTLLVLTPDPDGTQASVNRLTEDTVALEQRLKDHADAIMELAEMITAEE